MREPPAPNSEVGANGSELQPRTGTVLIICTEASNRLVISRHCPFKLNYTQDWHILPSKLPSCSAERAPQPLLDGGPVMQGCGVAETCWWESHGDVPPGSGEAGCSDPGVVRCTGHSEGTSTHAKWSGRQRPHCRSGTAANWGWVSSGHLKGRVAEPCSAEQDEADMFNRAVF